MRILNPLVALSVAIISTSALASTPEVQHVSGSYGSVEYSANVTCGINDKTYTFSVSDLHLTFHPDTNVNKVDFVRNPHLSLITTVLRPGTTRGDVTSKSSQLLTLTLDRKNRTATLGAQRFVVAEQKVDESTYTALTLSDGHLLWPLPGNLKSCALSSNSSFEPDGSAAAQLKR
jgi:hypothetical protein